MSKPIRFSPQSVTLSADLLTPVTAFLRLSQGTSQSFLFESVEGGEQISRFSFMGINPLETLFIHQGIFQIRQASGSTRSIPGNPVQEMGKYLRQYQTSPQPGLPPFVGGAIGYLGYETSQYLEKTNAAALPPHSSYEAYLMVFRTVVAFDHVRKEITLVCQTPENQSPKDAQAELEALRLKLQKPSPQETPLNFSDLGPEVSQPLSTAEAADNKSRFLAGVKKIKQHIRSGDIFQCVLSEKFTEKLDVPPFLLYRTLRSVSPAPYLFYIQMGEETLLGASPEMLVRVQNGKVETCPIAGTRPRGKNPQEDAKLEDHLRKSTKERAEHLMLVDLGRNDIGKVSHPGTVSVKNFMETERFSHVMHLVSKIEGKLAKNKTAWDALTSCFPAGTLTGAPKIRAMQIISELEPTARGTYGGAVIYHDFSGNLDSCIAIRSIFCRKEKAYLQAGAGIVADSSPEREYEEILRKLQSVKLAFNLARKQDL